MTQMLAEPPTTGSGPDITHVMTCGDPNRALCGRDITDAPITLITEQDCNICADLDFLLDCTCEPGCPCCDNT